MKWSRSEQPLLVVLLLIAAWSLCMPERVYWYALLITAVLGLNLAWGFVLPGPARSLWAFLLMVPFGFWIRQTSFISTGMPHFAWLLIIGYYGVALGSYTLLASRTLHERLQAMAAAFFAFALSGAVPENPFFNVAIILFLPVLLWQIRKEIGLPPGPPRFNLHAVRIISLTLFILCASMLLHRGIIRASGAVNRWLVELIRSQMPTPNIGFDKNKTIAIHHGPWLGLHKDRIMLRVWAQEQPPYLRGATYQTYQGGQWSILDTTTPLASNQVAPAGRTFFSMTGEAATEPVAYIYPEQSLGRHFFVPLGTHVIAAYGSRVTHNAAYAVSTPENSDTSSAGGYAIYQPMGEIPASTPEDLAVPENLRPHLEQVLAGITSADDPPAIRAHKIIEWFHANFFYELGVDPKPGQDPILSFFERKTGHCEYYATSAALLLRTAGIPARYLTGFVAVESISKGIWAARNKDAHAWVEAYLPVDPSAHDPAARMAWTTLEPTPSNGRPTPSVMTLTDKFMGMLRSWWDRFYQILAFGGLAAVIAVLWEASVALFGLVPVYGWAVVGLLALGWVFRQNLRRLFRLQKREKVSPFVRGMRQKLHQAEKLALPHGVTRDPAATISTFLGEVRQGNVPPETRAKIETLLAEYQSQRFRPHA